MRVNAINSTSPNLYTNRVQKKYYGNNNSLPRVISFSEYLAQPLAFTGANRDKQQVIFIGAESDPWSKAGGVGTVMKDYRSFGNPKNQIEITPYYGAGYDENKKVVPLKDSDGDYVMPTSSGNIKLELVAKDKMQWGKVTNDEIMLFRRKDDSDKLSYFVFTDDTAIKKKPYEGTTAYKSGAKAQNNGWNGDAYAKFSKAAVMLLPKAIEDKGNFNPATVICSDSQTAYVQEYLAQQTVNDKTRADYEGIKPTYVGHNMGPGYCGETSKQNMFVNLGATPNQIHDIEQDPMYKQGLLGDDYFKPFVKDTLDETGTASAVMIPIHYANKKTANGHGYTKAFTVVSEEYAKNIADNPQAAHNIHNKMNELYKQGVFSGILNPLNDTSVHATKPLPNKLYNEDCTDTDGTIHPKFELYPENVDYKQMRQIKNSNKLKLFKRLQAQDNSIITGDAKRKADVNPELPAGSNIPPIKPEIIKLLEEGKGDQVPLFISWGRSDTQKGHDITLKSFEKFAKTPEGKNAVLILGAGLDTSDESKKVEKILKEMLNDPELQGRVVHINGWAPSYAMASAADAAIFSSRFEPCGLTDLEAMKYYCTPIVTNTQGFKQKNFDPRIATEAQKATSYKTAHEFNLTEAEISPIVKAYIDGNETAKEMVKTMFPVFLTTNKKGEETFDDAIFKEFADNYSTYLNAKKEAILADPLVENLPPRWNNWDDISKDYAFKYGGFARDFKDGILTAEMADAIRACATSDDKTKELIFNNLKQLKTGWNENQSLHPDGRSSAEMYRQVHMEGDWSAPQKEDIITKDDTFVKSVIEKRQSRDIKERVSAYTVGGLTGLAGILFARTGRKEYKSKEEALLRQINELETKIAQMAKTNKRNMIITGVASAAAMGLLVFIATRNYMKKQMPKDKEMLVIPEPKLEEQNHINNPTTAPMQKSNVQLGMSLSDFQNGLKK